MRIVVLSQHFPPETVAVGRRAMDVAEELTKRGHEVEVVTGQPNHPGSVIDTRTGRGVESASGRGYRVHRVGVWRTPWRSALQRMLTYSSFMASATFKVLRLARHIDVI